MELLHHSGAQSVAACFSSYLANLFIKALKEKEPSAIALPFYCSPYMAEEILLSQCDFPGGTFHAIVPWGTSLQGEEQTIFKETIRREKNKAANIFHLLGWEAGIVSQQVVQAGINSLKGFAYNSPRGTVTIHPVTQHTYAPLYKGEIVVGEGGNAPCKYRKRLRYWLMIMPRCRTIDLNQARVGGTIIYVFNLCV